MKSRVSPLAIGAFAAFVALLAFAYWGLTSTEALSPSETSLESAEGHPSSASRVESAQPLDPDSNAQSTAEGARVALADESAARVLPQVEFELRSSSERPLSGAGVLLFSGEVVLGKRECDPAGVASFDSGEGSASLLVVAKNVPAFVRDVPIAAGRHVLTLERGVAVSGRVRVASKESLEGISLVLHSDRPLIDESTWPEAVRRELEIDDRDKLRLSTRTDAAGAFEFTGLMAPWSGRLEVGDTHELLAVSGAPWSFDSGPIRLDDPVEGLILDVAALPLATGRVVLSAGGPGVARASVTGQMAFAPPMGEEEATSASFDGRARDDGRFALPIHRQGRIDPEDLDMESIWPTLKSATLTLDAGENVPRRRLELSGTQLPEGFDFGELVLERGATLHFEVVDGQSKPLAGAVGRLDGERSEPTDESGRSSVAYAPGIRRPLAVALHGYRDARVEVPQELAEVLNVVLTRTNRLTVVVRGPGGIPVADVEVQVIVQVPAGQRPNRRGINNRTTDQDTDEQGRATFNDLPVGTPVRVLVRDAMGGAVVEKAVTLEAEEWRTLELEISRALLAFSGVIRDEAGLALAEASVEFALSQGGGGNNVSRRSDAEGRFTFTGLNHPVGILRVRKSGFAPVTIVDFQIPQPGVIADIRMERGLRLCLRIVDERGASVRGDSLRMELAGERPFFGRRNADNGWDFFNLPRETMTAVGSVGAREYRQSIEPLNGNQDFRVPAQGRLEVSLRLDPALLQSTLRISLRARDDRRVTLSQSLEQKPFQTRKFEPILPGEYQLTIAQYSREEPRGNWVNVGAPQRVVIAAGAPQLLELER